MAFTSLSELINNRTIVLLDWVGSLLMLGTVWGWVYSKISPAIKQKLEESDHHCRAIRRFMRIKYGADFGKVDAIRRFFEHREKIGIYPTTTIITAFSIRIEETRIHSRLEKYGLATEEDKRIWGRNRSDSREFSRIVVGYYLSRFKYEFQFNVMKIIDVITLSVFSGKIAFFLFLSGFILWNLSKALSLYVLKE